MTNKRLPVSDDELRQWAQMYAGKRRKAAILGLLDERDRLAARVAELEEAVGDTTNVHKIINGKSCCAYCTHELPEHYNWCSARALYAVKRDEPAAEESDGKA